MGTPTVNGIPIQRFGLTEVYRPPGPIGSAKVDLVLIHGLSGRPYETWLSKNTNVFWPSQLLPPWVEEQKVRVLVYGYDADVTSGSVGVTKDKIHNHAERLVADLVANRRMRKALERPLIFVAHSLGGLILKRALIWSSEVTSIKTEHLRSVYVSTYGILFLGTPHRGSDLAVWGSYLEWLCRAVVPKKVLDSAPQLVDALKKDSETLQIIDRQFTNLMTRFHIYFFHEAKPTNIKGTLRFVVDEDSAAPNLPDVERAGIQADHSEMCKFDSETSPGFDLIVDAIQRYADESEATIRNHWASERKERQLYRELLAQGLFPNQTGSPPSDAGSAFQHSPDNSFHGDFNNSQLMHHESPKSNSGNPSPRLPSEPYFYVPPGFRPNSLFVGMQRELLELDRKLFDHRREEGTASVLLYGPAGAGKSHVARQYVNKNRVKFDGGIFWITARSIVEMDNDYWQIAQKYVAKDSPDLRLTNDKTVRDFVDVVKMWFEDRSDWLIVFDGVTIETDQEVAELSRYVPNKPHSSLLYISMSDELKSRHRLLNPSTIKVKPLSEADARSMLFQELGLRHPNEAQLNRATRLVKEVSGLPLAINAISHRLVATRERLETYKIQSYSADPKLGGPYRQIMIDLIDRNHVEAWNLIHVLCFWGKHIPVEMIHFGMKSLKLAQVKIKSGESGQKPDINTTYAILIRFALIERNEPDDRGSTSSSRDSFYNPDTIDMLKIHTVVQNFCCDDLKSRGDLPQWLGYAVGVFCLSYDEADFRISRKPQPGLVSDYREYLSHGKYLRGHVLKYLKKSPDLEAVHARLESVMEKIEEEIRKREPGSSQESVKSVDFQPSVFDRTSSTSSSGHSDPKNHLNNRLERPDLSLDGSRYGLADEEAPFESPSSILTNSPTYQLKPGERDPQTHKIAGYQGDGNWGNLHMSVPMEKTPSDVTARPYTPRQESFWPLIRPDRPYSPNNDLGTFRPAPVQAEVDRNLATGSVVRPSYERRGSVSGSSNAINSLTAVHRASPPRSRGGGAIRTTDRLPQPLRSRPTWAEVVAHTSRPSQPTQHLSNGPWGEDMLAPTSGLESERGRPLTARPATATMDQSSRQPEPVTRSRAATESRQTPLGLSKDGSSTLLSRLPHSSPLRQSDSFDPVHAPLAALSRDNSSNELSRSLNSLPQHVYYYYQPPTISGSNPAPLPYESDITIRRPSTTSPRPTYQTPFQPPAYPYSSSLGRRAGPTTSIPKGYYSQPVSRVHSDHSNGSSAATEPPLPHTIHPSPFFNTTLMDSGSTRSRLPNGAPMGKSPKFPSLSPGFRPRTSSSDNAMYDPPLSPYNLAETVSLTQRDIISYPASGPNHAPSHATNIHFSPGPSDYGSPLPPSSAPMSRGSSGAGGFAIDDNNLIEFGHNGEVSFGMMEPLRIEDARRRTREREEQLNSRRGSREIREEERAGWHLDALGILKPSRRESVTLEIRGNPNLPPAATPYPDINRIPTDAAESRAVVDSPPPGENRAPSSRSGNSRK